MMAALTEDAPARYTLERAILLYRDSANARLAMHHEVRHDADGTARLGEGTFATGSIVRELLELLDRSPLTYVPPNVVATARTAVAWYEPASVRTMYFEPMSDPAVGAMSGKRVPQPPLVFIAADHRLHVYALAEDERPTLETPLYDAPYWNTYEDGGVCLGSMRIPKTLDPMKTAAWTRAFFGSSFTHLTGSKNWKRPGTYAELLQAAVAEGAFAPAWLKRSKVKTIGDAICGD